VPRKKTGLTAVLKDSEQLISMIMGILVVLIIGGLAYRFFQGREPEIESGIETETVPEEGEEQPTALPATHTVSKGEHLWAIAERYYQSGYNWVDIAQANNLANPDVLLIGQELEIPNVEPKEPTIAGQPAEQLDITITGDRYTIQEGDSLSKIAQAAYGDLFQWPRIWESNRELIADPDLIFPGIEIKIPR